MMTCTLGPHIIVVTMRHQSTVFSSHARWPEAVLVVENTFDTYETLTALLSVDWRPLYSHYYQFARSWQWWWSHVSWQEVQHIQAAVMLTHRVSAQVISHQLLGLQQTLEQFMKCASLRCSQNTRFWADKREGEAATAAARCPFFMTCINCVGLVQVWLDKYDFNCYVSNDINASYPWHPLHCCYWPIATRAPSNVSDILNTSHHCARIIFQYYI